MLPRDHALCQCEVADYHDVAKVLPLLRAPAAPPLPLKPPSPPPAHDPGLKN